MAQTSRAIATCTVHVAPRWRSASEPGRSRVRPKHSAAAPFRSNPARKHASRSASSCRKESRHGGRERDRAELPQETFFSVMQSSPAKMTMTATDPASPRLPARRCTQQRGTDMHRDEGRGEEHVGDAHKAAEEETAPRSRVRLFDTQVPVRAGCGADLRVLNLISAGFSTRTHRLSLVSP